MLQIYWNVIYEGQKNFEKDFWIFSGFFGIHGFLSGIFFGKFWICKALFLIFLLDLLWQIIGFFSRIVLIFLTIFWISFEDFFWGFFGFLLRTFFDCSLSISLPVNVIDRCLSFWFIFWMRLHAWWKVYIYLRDWW